MTTERIDAIDRGVVNLDKRVTDLADWVKDLSELLDGVRENVNELLQEDRRLQTQIDSDLQSVHGRLDRLTGANATVTIDASLAKSQSKTALSCVQRIGKQIKSGELDTVSFRYLKDMIAAIQEDMRERLSGLERLQCQRKVQNFRDGEVYKELDERILSVSKRLVDLSRRTVVNDDAEERFKNVSIRLNGHWNIVNVLRKDVRELKERVTEQDTRMAELFIALEEIHSSIEDARAEVPNQDRLTFHICLWPPSLQIQRTIK